MASLHKYLTEASQSQTCIGYLETSAGRSLKKPEKWTTASAEPNSCLAKLHQCTGAFGTRCLIKCSHPRLALCHQHSPPRFPYAAFLQVLLKLRRDDHDSSQFLISLISSFLDINHGKGGAVTVHAGGAVPNSFIFLPQFLLLSIPGMAGKPPPPCSHDGKKPPKAPRK